MIGTRFSRYGRARGAKRKHQKNSIQNHEREREAALGEPETESEHGGKSGREREKTLVVPLEGRIEQEKFPLISQRLPIFKRWKWECGREPKYTCVSQVFKV